jgi:selenocysteine-specific elongation factor
MNAPVPRQIVVGTAGHIDHGKSRLVQALTGTDPDRLKEEKERGITIDLGFAHLRLADGTRIGFVDVPGHERFVKNMLAGVGGIDLVILVIAADESIKPQTREHFDICRLLQIPRGIVALTKADLVEPDILDLVRLEVREFLAGSFLEDAAILPVSSRTGQGLDDLKRALGEAAARTPPRPAGGLVRLPVDRVFTVKGFGTVVTGTLTSGTIREGDELVVLPQGTPARVRGLQVFGETTTVALPGQRTAVNLHGVEGGAIERGALLTTPGVLQSTHLLDVRIEAVASAPGPIKDMARVRFHHGTLEALARVKILGGGAIPPGGSGFAQLRLEQPVVVLPGDRCILRRYSPPLTVAGAAILDNQPPKLRAGRPRDRDRFQTLADPDPARRLAAIVEDAGGDGLDLAALRARTGLDEEALARQLEASARGGWVVPLTVTPRRWLAAEVDRRMRAAVVAAIEEYHRREPLQEGLPKEEIRTRIFARVHPDVFRAVLGDLAATGRVRFDKDRVALATHRIALSARDADLIDRIEARFAVAGANPPELQDIAAALRVDPAQAARLFHLLLGRGRLVRIHDGKVFHVQAIDDLKRRLWTRRAENPILDVGEFKDLSGTSRKNAIPLLEYFDQARITRREGNRRVILPPPAGPAPGVSGTSGSN